jgi:hypothetical protein
MNNVSNGGVRRYSDLLTTGYIKTGADGHKIFYPWGMLGYGYIFPSDGAYERMNVRLKIFTVMSLALTLPPAVSGSYVAATGFMILVLACYWVWMCFELGRLQRTEEKLTYRVSFTNFARLLPAWLVWAELIACLVLVVGGAIALMISPAQWIIALGSILFFGAGVVLCAMTLVLRRRVAREQS